MPPGWEGEDVPVYHYRDAIPHPTAGATARTAHARPPCGPDGGEDPQYDDGEGLLALTKKTLEWPTTIASSPKNQLPNGAQSPRGILPTRPRSLSAASPVDPNLHKHNCLGCTTPWRHIHANHEAKPKTLHDDVQLQFQWPIWICASNAAIQRILINSQ